MTRMVGDPTAGSASSYPWSLAYGMRSRRVSFDIGRFFRDREVVLASIIAFATGGALAVAGVKTAGLVLWIGTAIGLVVCLLLDGPAAAAVVVLGLSPLLNFLRQSIFYSSVVALLGVTILLLLFGRPRLVQRILKRYRFVVPFGVLATAYWLWTYINVHRYIVNFRIFEFFGSLLLVLAISQEQNKLNASLRSLTISSITYGLGLLVWLGPANVGRLGMVLVGHERVGNPITLGAPLALVFIALFVDGGGWLGFRSWRLWRVALTACVVFLIALSTSRASWSVVLATLALSFLLSRRRAQQVFGILLMVCVVWLIVKSPFWGSFDAGLERTVSFQSDVSRASSGRSDQWRVAGWALRSSFAHLLLGFGPGMGPEVYAEYSTQGSTFVRGYGHKMEWHSLLLHTGIELGLLCPVALLALLFGVAWRAWRFYRKTGLLFPLACFVGYFLIVMTVIGFDVSSGFYLGLALLPSRSSVSAARITWGKKSA